MTNLKKIIALKSIVRANRQEVADAIGCALNTVNKKFKESNKCRFTDNDVVLMRHFVKVKIDEIIENYKKENEKQL